MMEPFWPCPLGARVIPLTGIAANDLLWRPILPPLQIALFAVLLAILGLASYAYAFRSSANRVALVMLALVRLAGVAALVVLLMGPSRIPVARSDSQRLTLGIVLDVSDSMQTDDCQGMTRAQSATRTWLNYQQVQQWNHWHHLQFYTLGEDLVPQAWEEMERADEWMADRRESQLARNTRKAVEAQSRGRASALLLLSDGHDTEDALPEPVAELARSRGIPIHTVTFGQSTQQLDLMLVAMPMQDYLLPNEPGTLLVKAYQFGLPQARTVLHLRQGQSTRSVPLEFQGKSVVELQLEIQQTEEGQYEYELELEPVSEEVLVENNRQRVFCQVQEKRLRVLVLEGQPFWDTKFIAQSLRKDERIELTQITQVGPENRETLVSRADRQEARVPTSAEQWAEYDVVIVGSELQNLLDANLADQLRNFVVNEGGHVVFARGRCYDPNDPDGAALERAFAEVEPLRWSGTTGAGGVVQPDPSGLPASWFAESKLGMNPRDVFRDLPGLDTLHEARRLKPAARALLTMDSENGTQPALVTMPAGRGQVVALLGSGSWRWSLRPPTDPAQSSFYDIFWSNLVRWLVMGGDFQPGQQVSLRLSDQSVRFEDPLTVEVVFRNPVAAERPWSVAWYDAEGRSQQLNLTRVPGQSPRFRATIAPRQVGVHRVELTAPELSASKQQKNFNVYEMNLERLETSARPGFLKTLAERSGGQIIPPDRPEQLLGALRRQLVSRMIPPEPEYIWDHWLIMLGLLTWCGGEWLLRRMAGLW